MDDIEPTRDSAAAREHPLTLYTVGHSNLSGAAFLELLAEARIGCLIDVRSRPGSRRNPQFNQATLAAALGARAIEYVWEGPALGGRRERVSPGLHPGLERSFMKAYAEHMRSGEFREALERVLLRRERGPSAVMCAERLPAHCHRSLIADYAVLRGVRVVHLIARAPSEEHTPHPALRESGGALLYDLDSQLGLDLDHS